MSRLAERISRLSIRTRLFTLVTVILLATIAILDIQQVNRLTSVIQGEALEKARSDLQTGMEILDLKYPGEWRAEEDRLYKGDTLINDNFEIVDTLGRLTNGDTATLFLGDTRVTTNVIADGKRAVGTKVSEAVADKVLKKGEIYMGRANVVGHTYQAAYMPLKDAGGKVIGIWYVGAPDADERIGQIKRDLTVETLVSGALIIGVALLLFYGITSPMMNRLQASARLIRTIADGDLTTEDKPVKSKDETGLLLQSSYRMSRELRSVLSQVNEAASLVALSSQELSASTEQSTQATEQTNLAIQEIAVGAEKQMSGVARSTEAVQEVSKGMDRAAHSIQRMADEASSARDNAVAGAQTASETVERMRLAQQTVEEAASAIRVLEAKSKAIGQIVDVINRMSSQTNILALNASIEASRAGEQGKGFAVVAAEVRKLAEESGRSADKISELIKQVQTDSDRAALAMSKGTQVVQEGLDQALRSGAAFDEIAGAIGEVSTHSQEVSAIVEQVHAQSRETADQMETIAEIVRQSVESVQRVAASAEEQNASSEEISASSANLGHMADDLRKRIGKFKVN